jgi:hypothetical protein
MEWQETFDEVVERLGNNPIPLRSHGNAWRENEDKKLVELVELGGNRTQITEHFPFRTWRSMRERITKIIGTSVEIKGRGEKQ